MNSKVRINVLHYDFMSNLSGYDSLHTVYSVAL